MRLMWKQAAGIKGGKVGSDGAVAPNHLPRHVWWSKVGPRLHGCFLRGGLGVCQNQAKCSVKTSPLFCFFPFLSQSYLNAVRSLLRFKLRGHTFGSSEMRSR